MEKKIIFVTWFMLFLVCVGMAGAVTIEMNDDYSSGQTVITKITGNILEQITSEQVQFKRGNVLTPIIFEINKVGSDHYLWFITPLNETQKNYTLFISDVKTTYLGENIIADLTKNFSVQGSLGDYYIEPGFVITKQDFTITATLNRDYNQNIEIDYPIKKTFTLMPGKNYITFSIEDFPNTEFRNIKVGKYSVPAYIIKNDSIVVIKRNNTVSIQPDAIDSVRFLNDSNINYSFVITNTGENIIEDIYLEYNKSLFSIIPDKKISLAPGNKTSYNLSVLRSFRQDFTKMIYIKSDKNGFSYILPVKIDFIANRSEISYLENVSMNSSSNLYSCTELLGDACSAQETCTGEIVISSTGSCCKGICQETKQGAGLSWIGYLLIMGVIVALVFIYLKYKKAGVDKHQVYKEIDKTEKVKRIP